MSMVYPKEFYIELVGNDNLLGRLTVFQSKEAFSVEVDIVLKESKKIFKHIGIFHNQEIEQEAVDYGVLKLSHFLESVKNQTH